MYTPKKAYFYGTGRRKSSVARVRLFPGGTGEIKINNRTIDREDADKAVSAIHDMLFE